MKEEENDTLTSNQHEIPPHDQDQSICPIFQAPTTATCSTPQRHIYLEEENAYGRFVPFLLLKDQLHSQIDTSGTSALIHMCSHNSPYIPLYLSTLKQGDPLLNRPNNMGHTCLDVAGLYCRRAYVDLLREKGAIDDGKVDHWAIQGANLANWSGKVNPEKKNLMHWAAYNDLPDVLAEYHRAGADFNELDAQGNSVIDLAVMNKSYKSCALLKQLNYSPKEEALKKCNSKYLNELFKKEGQWENAVTKFKKVFIVLFLLMCNLISDEMKTLTIITLALYLHLACSTFTHNANPLRDTLFFSQMVGKYISYESNHFRFLLLTWLLVVDACCGVLSTDIGTSISKAVGVIVVGVCGLAWGVLGSVLAWGVLKNVAWGEIVHAERYKENWSYIQYITHRRILKRVYRNKKDKGWKSNLMYYWNYR